MGKGRFQETIFKVRQMFILYVFMQKTLIMLVREQVNSWWVILPQTLPTSSASQSQPLPLPCAPQSVSKLSLIISVFDKSRGRWFQSYKFISSKQLSRTWVFPAYPVPSPTPWILSSRQQDGCCRSKQHVLPKPHRAAEKTWIPDLVQFLNWGKVFQKTPSKSPVTSYWAVYHWQEKWDNNNGFMLINIYLLGLERGPLASGLSNTKPEFY